MKIKHMALSVLAFMMLAPLAKAEDAVSPALPIQIFGLEFNHITVVMCFIVAVVICVMAWLCMRHLAEVPGRGQLIMEMLFGAFDGLVQQAMGSKASARKYLPWIGSLFLFLWTSNMIGMVPVPHMSIGAEGYNDYNHNGDFDPGEFAASFDTNKNGKQDPGFPFPKFEEPTKDYNVPAGMALLFVIIIGHGAHMRKHGFLGYVKSYFDPGGIMGVVMFPLNVVGKVAEFVSISFRLFGNIFGGAVIIVVVSSLLHHLILPVGLLGFFGVFVGTVQAFVFTMLALTYISLGAADEEEEEHAAAEAAVPVVAEPS